MLSSPEFINVNYYYISISHIIVFFYFTVVFIPLKPLLIITICVADF